MKPPFQTLRLNPFPTLNLSDRFSDVAIAPRSIIHVIPHWRTTWACRPWQPAGRPSTRYLARLSHWTLPRRIWPLAGCRIASPDTMLRCSSRADGAAPEASTAPGALPSSTQRSHGSAITQPALATRTTETPQPQTQQQAATPRFAQTRRQQGHTRMRAT